MASTQDNALNSPNLSPLSSPSSSESDSTVIVIVFVSFGCVFALAFVLLALCCFLKQRKKKKTVQETDDVCVDERMKIKEDIVKGPHGAQAVVLTIEDDVHIEEEIRKNEKLGRGIRVKSSEVVGSSTEIAEAESSASSHV